MELKKLSDLYWKVSPNLFFFSTFLSILSGLCYSAIIPFLMYILGSGNFNFNEFNQYGQSIFDSPTANIAIIFILSCFFLICLKYISNMMSGFIAEKASLRHRVYLFRLILDMPYAEVEKYGQSKLLNILRVDVAAVNSAATSYPSIWISSVIVIGVMTYLIYIDFKVFLYVVSIAFVSILIFRIPFSIGTKKIAQSREYTDKIQESVKGLIFGAKELGLNRERAEDYYYNELYCTERELRKLGLIARAFIQLADHFGELMTFIIIAVVIFHFPYVFSISQGELTAVVISLVYLSNPMSQIMNAAGEIQRGKVSLDKLQEFYKCTQRELDIQPVAEDWQHYSIRNLTYLYSKEEDSFGLRAANATFKKGQITYIVGGNGSGKSTLSKCLTLHYTPTEGHIFLDDKVIQPKQIEAARQQISAIYSDYYLFNKLHGIDYESMKSKIDNYLKMLELEGKVTLTDGRFSTTSLSDGQKKRLALLVLLLEDRQVCLFDEWAADQDPRFKQIFYTRILPELKSRNKVVIVITHDDRFFYLADQLITMEYGKVKSIVDIEKTDTQAELAV